MNAIIVSDLHIGSRYFLHQDFQLFIKNLPKKVKKIKHQKKSNQLVKAVAGYFFNSGLQSQDKENKEEKPDEFSADKH